jgi:DNA-binding IclR family transcriptional regulator
LIKVIEKALNILEFIASSPNNQPCLNEIAKQFRLNKATAYHIVKTLLERGYIEKSPFNKGYFLGPMAYYLIRNNSYRKDLLIKAEPLLIQLAHKIKAEVMLITKHYDKRYILCRVNGNEHLQIKKDLEREEAFYKTASGRLLLAFSPPDEINAFIIRNGLPGEEWPEVNNEEKLLKALSEIRNNECSIIDFKQVVAFSFPIRENLNVVAALGLWILKINYNDEKKRRICEDMKNTSFKISNKLNESLEEHFIKKRKVNILNEEILIAINK